MNRDLDWSDVMADADNQFDEFLQSLLTEDEAELARLRYRYGSDARLGEPHAVAVVATIDYARSPEGEQDRYAMGYADHAQWEADSYNRDLEAESLGRPLFPNEY